MQRKIIHIDMDCFYAAIEMRDNPSLRDKPVAVGGSPDSRGVISTCNYIARQFGVHSAMPSAMAYRQCKNLVLLPVQMSKYKRVAQKIHAIFQDYSDLVEPLSLDEAYLDVTGSKHHQGSATWIAQAIRQRIFHSEGLTASAGIAPNKFLAKIASGWKKPNGIFVITPQEVDSFVTTLPIKDLSGVGRVNADKLNSMRVTTCTDLQQIPLHYLIEKFGKLGHRLYEQSRGIDERPVIPNRMRKSLSVETTFPTDIANVNMCLENLNELYDKLKFRIQETAEDMKIKSLYLKIKSSDFKISTTENMSEVVNLELYYSLFKNLFNKEKRSIRLLGLGVNFQPELSEKKIMQHSLFE